MTYQEALEQAGGNKAEAARQLGISPSTFKDRLNAELEGRATMIVTGRSTLRDPEGNVVLEWEKTSLDRQKAAEAQQAAYKALAAKLPRLPPVKPPRACKANLCTVYTLTDAHIGMLAWHREGGDDWDLEIAERTIVGCFEQAIRAAPDSEMAIFNQLGDLLHYDSLQSVTPTSGHLLDADGRFTKMVEVAVKVIRRVVGMLLEKHPRVHMILAEGNHDIASSVWLRTMFKALYEDEPRITVDDSALPYYALQWGKTAQFFHHSHLKKMERLPGFFAAQFPVIWGATKYRYVHTGDKHHAYEKDDQGAHIIQHPTLAARDAYAARFGWHSLRGMNAITFHRDFGQVGRVTVTPDMLEAA